MKILFSVDKVGLGNNGGSKTIIRCAETLVSLGCTVFIYGPNKYTWHHPVGINFVTSGKMPFADAVIATGYHSVDSVLKSNIKNKFYYIRGFENWVTSEKNLLKSYRSLNCIVNSTWLQSYLIQNNIKSHLVYPGLDFDIFYDEFNNSRNYLGALWHKRQTKRQEDAVHASNLSGFPIKMLNKDIKEASPEKCRSFYNSVKVWFAPTELEGLHNCPMEASLCGCSLVCTDHFQSGMSDYAIHNETALVYPSRNINIASQYIQELMNDESLHQKMVLSCQEYLRNKIQDRSSNMKKMLEVLNG